MRSLSRHALASAAILALAITSLASDAAAQTMRFTTNVGSFDMLLNPTNDANLQPLVDNIVAYIGLGRYHFSAINRAPDDFVLQMGTFLGFPNVPDQWATTLFEVERLPGVTTDADDDGQVDFSALSNTRGMVSLALSAAGPNSGTSSFFVNVGDNSSNLDPQGFVPFAQIVNMGTVDEIMDLTKRDLGDEAGAPGSATFTDVPITDDGQIVLIETVRVLQADPNFSFVGPISRALAQQSSSSATATLVSAAASSSLAAAQAATMPAVGAAPEPAAGTLAILAAMASSHLARRGRGRPASR